MEAAVRTLSWIEIAFGCLLFAASLWVFQASFFGPIERDPHGFVFYFGLVGIVFSLSLLAGGLLLRAASRWRWLGQVVIVVVALGLWASDGLF